MRRFPQGAGGGFEPCRQWAQMISPDISSVLTNGDLRAGPASCKIKVLKQYFDFARRQGHVDRLYHKTHLIVISPAAESGH
jgi:hypothetical protein